jgi:hypothetical protein
VLRCSLFFRDKAFIGNIHSTHTYISGILENITVSNSFILTLSSVFRFAPSVSAYPWDACGSQTSSFSSSSTPSSRSSVLELSSAVSQSSASWALLTATSFYQRRKVYQLTLYSRCSRRKEDIEKICAKCRFI